jgi:2-(1,2-epoxy-1,2-dihydrophenyl)acetyl-CoA isomerase
VETTDFNDIIVEERANGVALVKLNRPEKLNAFGGTMNEELARYLESLNHGDYRVRAVVLTGEGRAFCAGGNVMSFPAADPNRAAATWHPGHPHLQVVNTMRHCDVPIIAAINGYAVGAGWSLALACDVRIASDEASFIPAFINIGLIPDTGGTWSARRLLGPARAFEWLTSGRRLTAAEALQWGLVSEVVPAAELASRAAESAARYAAMPTRAVWQTKRLLDAADTGSLEEQLEDEAVTQAELAATRDFGEGVAAFLEKRPPSFAGE